MSEITSGSHPCSNIVIFDSSSSSSTTFHTNHSTLISCRDGPQKLTGYVKRGRPRKARQISPFGNCNQAKQANKNLSTSDFSFVTYTASPQDAGPEIQKLVRRSAMLNYQRRQREQKSVVEEAKNSRARRCSTRYSFPDGHDGEKGDNEVLQQYIASDHMNSVSSETTTVVLPKEITTVEPFNAFPIEIEPYMLDLLSSYTTSVYETMYTIEKHVNLNPARGYWLPLAFQDAALLHAFIFCADGHGTISQGRKEGPAAVIHLRKAIQIVNERLRAPLPSITDATIAVVCTFAHSEILNGNHENWTIHMRGLKQMLRQRGGMRTFESNRLLRSKINRADLCGSIVAVQSPYFDLLLDNLPTVTVHQQMEIITTTGFGRITDPTRLDKSLARIICQIQDVTVKLNSFYHNKTHIHPLNLREAITSAQYSLLSFKPQHRKNTHENLIHEMLRLSLLLYLVTLLNESAPKASPYDKLGARLKSSFIEIRRSSSLDLDFSLWIMFMAASMFGESTTKSYFMASATEIMEELGISCWENVETLFKAFLWVDNIHRGTFRPIWEILKTIHEVI